MKRKIHNIISYVSAALHSSRGRDVLTYLMFVVVAFIFWVFMSLDSEMQRDFEVPVEISEVPDSVTMLVSPPTSLAVSVRGKDSQLVRFMWGKMSPLKFKWKDNVSGSLLSVSSSRLDTKIREYFGSGVEMVACRPDSINVPFTTMPGVKVKLNIKSDIHPHIQYILSSAPYSDVDSVALYSATDIPHSIKSVSTEMIVKQGLKDTTQYEVGIQPIEGIRIVPDRVTVTVPVEPLISRKMTAVIEPEGVPQDKHLVTFPSRVEVSYLVPMSSYGKEFVLKAYVKYEDTRLPGNRLPVTLSTLPGFCHSVSFSPESVEYIIEEAQ
ncbi:MAG: hypothetical protein HDS49_04000 [Bacteroides sp.]|nr:hypothetical protein [Bacteroides sp.]